MFGGAFKDYLFAPLSLILVPPPVCTSLAPTSTVRGPPSPRPLATSRPTPLSPPQPSTGCSLPPMGAANVSPAVFPMWLDGVPPFSMSE